jgi:hypothetical protein
VLSCPRAQALSAGQAREPGLVQVERVPAQVVRGPARVARVRVARVRAQGLYPWSVSGQALVKA